MLKGHTDCLFNSQPSCSHPQLEPFSQGRAKGNGRLTTRGIIWLPLEPSTCSGVFLSGLAPYLWSWEQMDKSHGASTASCLFSRLPKRFLFESSQPWERSLFSLIICFLPFTWVWKKLENGGKDFEYLNLEGLKFCVGNWCATLC